LNKKKIEQEKNIEQAKYWTRKKNLAH